MGKLLIFPRQNRPESEQIEPGREAELVMFSGVRYERQQQDDETERETAQKRESGG